MTSPWVRQHDVGGHREYIDFMATHGRLPAVQQGWETWQPPLYYVLAAVWRWPFSVASWEDPFRPVQFLGAVLYLAAILLALLLFRRFQLKPIEAFAGLAILALLPGNLFFAARISNDTVLPLLGAAVLWVAAEFAGSGHRRWLWWLATLLPMTLAAKGSSLAVVGGALLVVLWTELRRSAWARAALLSYLSGMPAALCQLLFWVRNFAQTGQILYTNIGHLPQEMRLLQSPFQRLFSPHLGAFLGGGYHYDGPVSSSYLAAMASTALCGEYSWNDYGVEWSKLLRCGFLSLLLILLAGALVRPRLELRPIWFASVCMAACQTTLITLYSMRYPFTCNQNIRFLAQAFVPFACLWGLGVGQFWERGGWTGRLAVLVIAGAFTAALSEFYLRLLFSS